MSCLYCGICLPKTPTDCGIPSQSEKRALTCKFQLIRMLWAVPGSTVSPPIWRCRPAPDRAPWWLVWQQSGSFPPPLHSLYRWWTGHKTRSSEQCQDHRTPSRVTSSTLSICSATLVNSVLKFQHQTTIHNIACIIISIWHLVDAPLRCSFNKHFFHKTCFCDFDSPFSNMTGHFFSISHVRLLMCVVHLAGQLWLLHETTAVGLTKWLHSELSNTSSSPSASLPQYSTLLANPPPHVTLHTPCLNRHLAVIKWHFSNLF